MSDIPIPMKVNGELTSDVGSQYLTRPNEGLRFSDGKTFSSGANYNSATDKFEPNFDGPRQESAYWDNDITYQKMLKQIQGLPVGSAERNALVAQLADYKANKFDEVVRKIPRNPSSPPKTYPPTAAATPTTPAATPTAANAPATPPATLAPTPAPTPIPATPASNPGFMLSPQGAPTPPQGAPTLGAPAVTASSASTQNTPASQPAKTGLTVDQVNQLKKRYEDALMMPMSSDPQTAQKQRLYLEDLQKELGRAMSGPMGKGMEAGGVRLNQQSQARDEANKATSDRKADADASVVVYQAKQYLASKGQPATDEDVAKFLKDKGYTGDGHKLGKNIFAIKEKEDKRRSDVKTISDLMRGGMLGGGPGQQGHQIAQGNGPDMTQPGGNPNHFTPVQIKALSDQRQKEQNTQPARDPMEGTKSQLEQMYKAGFIDEAAFRKGMDNPYGHGKTIEKIYDQYVQRFNPQDPNQPSPQNSA